MVCVSDSAYKVEPEECRALVGHLILWMGQTPTNMTAPFGPCTVLDFECRKQKRVCRSTFAAEVRGLNDSLEKGRLIQLCCEEILYGPLSASKALQMEEPTVSGRGFRTSLEAAIDAKSVFTAVEAKETKGSG